MKTKFSVGDIVIGNSFNTYGVTKRGVRHIVLATSGASKSNENIKVEVIEGNDKGYTDWVYASKFDLDKSYKKGITGGKGITGVKVVGKEPVSRENTTAGKQFTVEYNATLNATFIRVGDITIAVPVPEHLVSITQKHPDDIESDEIAKAVAYYRLAKGAKN
jgi:hypothetical protein